MEYQDYIQTIRELIKNLQSRILEISNLYQNLEYELASERFIFLTEDLMELMNGISMISAGYNKINIEEMKEKLESVLVELENLDYQLVADILLYEVNPLLHYWEEQFIDG